MISDQFSTFGAEWTYFYILDQNTDQHASPFKVRWQHKIMLGSKVRPNLTCSAFSISCDNKWRRSLYFIVWFLRFHILVLLCYKSYRCWLLYVTSRQLLGSHLGRPTTYASKMVTTDDGNAKLQFNVYKEQ